MIYVRVIHMHDLVIEAISPSMAVGTLHNTLFGVQTSSVHFYDA
jgi:hypothetical protein